MKNEKLNAVCFIFARGGSKGLPRKNLRTLDNKPLIAHSIEFAFNSNIFSSVLVSTDDEEIAEISKKYGAEVPFIRPAKLATDKAPEWKAWQHAVNWFKTKQGHFDIFVSLPPTSPFRRDEDLKRCIQILTADKLADGVITVSDSDRNPFFNMVHINSNNYAELLIEENKIFHRQEAPLIFDVTTSAYAFRPSVILEKNHIFECLLRTVKIPKELALDIDTPYDFLLAELLIEHRKKVLKDC